MEPTSLPPRRVPTGLTGAIELRARTLGLWIGPGVPEGKEVLAVGVAADFAVCVRDRPGRESFGFRESLSSDEASMWLDRHESIESLRGES